MRVPSDAARRRRLRWPGRIAWLVVVASTASGCGRVSFEAVVPSADTGRPDVSLDAAMDALPLDGSPPDAPEEAPPVLDAEPDGDRPDGTRVDAAVLANYAFVSSRPLVVGDAGLAGADAHCQSLAADAGLPGRYVAWLSTSTVVADERLAGARGWIRPDGRVVVDTVTDLRAGRMKYPIRLDETGADRGELVIPTGTTWNGSAFLAGANCMDWTSSDVTFALAGVSSAGGARFSDYLGTSFCSVEGHIYCFGVDLDVPVAPPAAEGRLAFLSTRTFFPGGGLAAADALCRLEAEDAGHAGTYLAWLSTSTAFGSTRFSDAGPTWVRADGVPLAPTAAGVLAGSFDVALDVLADGRIFAEPTVWVGSMMDSCADWTDATSARNGRLAMPYSTDPFTGYGPQRCDGAARIYCFER